MELSMNKIYSNSEIMKGVLEGLLSDVNRSRMNDSSNILEKWKSIITSIRSVVNPDCGKTMYFHSRIIDIKDDVIILQVDHPGFIQLFENHKKYILRGIQMKIPQLKIRNITYRLDKKDNYNTQRDLTRQEMEHAIDKETAKNGQSAVKTNENDCRISEKKGYPPELQAIFDRMRDSILTNDKKI